jgi:hypothetical protein
MADSQAARPLHPIVTLDYRVRMVSTFVAALSRANSTGKIEVLLQRGNAG